MKSVLCVFGKSVKNGAQKKIKNKKSDEFGNYG